VYCYRLLIEKDFVAVRQYLCVKENEILKNSLESFCDMYEKNKEQFDALIQDPTLHPPSKNFITAIRFLCNFKFRYRHQLDVLSFADQTNLHTEVLGLAVSILQTVMNRKGLGDDEKMHLQQAFLGKKLKPCLRRHRDGRLDGDFSYVFPELFLRQDIIKQRDWFRVTDDGGMTEFRTTDIDEGILNFVIKCFVDLYDTGLKAKFAGVPYIRAVRKLDDNGFTRC